MSASVLYRWPAAAEFGRTIPKTRFYEHAAVSSALRERFVAEVQRVTWAYKLADATVHLRGSSSVPEIQVFVIDAKVDDVSDGVLAAIDKAVRFPVIFEVNRGGEVAGVTRMVAAHKQLGEQRQSVSDYFTTEWVVADAPRAPLPAALDLPTLYAALLTPILPVPARPGERLSKAVDRVGQARKLEREVASLEKRLRNEPQFNRKVELRRKLRSRSAELDALNSPEHPTNQESQWTS